MRCLGQVLFLVESEKLDMCGDQPHLICLVAIAHHNMAVEQQGLGHFEEAVVSAQNARRLARLCLSYSNRWLEAFENTHRTCAESLTLRGNQISGAPRHRRDIGSVAASARWRGVSRPSTRRCPGNCGSSITQLTG